MAIHNGAGDFVGVDASAALTTLLYSGEHFDAKINQQYLRARFYDPATGRFNRTDPFSGNMQDPQSLHKYLYVHANPVNASDPTGLMTLGGLGVSMSISSNAQSQKGRSDISSGIVARNAASRATGRLGERIVRALYKIGKEGTIKIAGRVRKPDGLIRAKKLLSEVKNVRKLSYTRQLRDMAQWAQNAGFRMELWVRPSTTLSGPLQQAVQNGTIVLRYIPFV